MMSPTRQQAAWGLGAALGVAVVMQVWPFFRPFEPGPLPPEAQMLAQAERYAHPIPLAALAVRASMFLGLGLVLISGWAVAVERRWGNGRWRWPARILFLAGVYAWLWLLAAPFSVASHVHMGAFGLTNLTWPAWLKVVALGVPVPFATYLMGYLLIYCCMPILGRRWWLGAALLVLVVFHLAPEWVSRAQPIDPVEDLVRLEKGPHHLALTDVAAEAGADLDFYVVDQSKRSNQVNMYLTGRLGREYVVLTDTLIEQLTPAEAAVILAHELGHEATRHITVPVKKGLAVLRLLLALGLVHLVLGRRAVIPVERLQALLLVMLALRLVALAFLPVSSALTRYRERQADIVALEQTGEPEVFAQAVLKTAERNLEPYELPRWVYWLSATHPSVKERLAAARAWAPAP